MKKNKMTDLINRAETIPWFTQVYNEVWDKWPGPDDQDVYRIASLTQQLIDELRSHGADAEPAISNTAQSVMRVLADLKLIDIDEGLYNSKYFAGWIGSWLLSALDMCERKELPFPDWAMVMINEYENGNWPWGIDENNKPLVN